MANFSFIIAAELENPSLDRNLNIFSQLITTILNFANTKKLLP